MDRLIFYVGDTSPAIRRGLAVQGAGDEIPNPVVNYQLRVREQWSSTPTIEATMTVDEVTNELVYQPPAGTFPVEGVFRGWIYVDYGAGNVQQTDEFEILVLAHAPGQGTRVGAVYRACRALEPVAWDALRGYPEYGDPELQRVIDLAKLRVVGTAAPADDEAALDPRVVDYVAKKVLVDNVLHAAISFWSNQVIQQTARGNSEEVVTYPDRIRTAENAIVRYRGDLALQVGEVEQLTGSTSAYDAPAVDGFGPLLTPGLDEYRALPVTVQDYWRRTR
jgi:hypothetical protein